MVCPSPSGLADWNSREDTVASANSHTRKVLFRSQLPCGIPPGGLRTVHGMNGIPLHPLLVHIPVMLIPLVLLMTLPSLFSRRWFQRTAPLTLVFSLVAAAGSVLTAWSGEQLMESDGESSALLARHAELGEMTRNIALVLFVLILVQTVLFWRRRDGRTAPVPGKTLLHVALAALVVLVGIADVVYAVQAGAQLVWLD